MTTLKQAISHATMRCAETGRKQVVYMSQPEHYLWCSLDVWESQRHLTPQAEKLIEGDNE